MRYEILENNQVINTIEADEAFMSAQFQPGTYRLAEVQIQPTVEPVAPVEPRNISVGSFFDRFGTNKWAILADTNPMVQALVKDCSVRKYINLDDPQLEAGLNMLVTAGHAIDVQGIITSAVQPNEKP